LRRYNLACHAAARRADIALRTPKREWEGAALRNSETLCNNLLPILGARVTEAGTGLYHSPRSSTA
jgi:E3 ubiquitin-protein ligase UBR4